MLDDANIRRAMRIVEDAASRIEKDARFGDGLTPHEIILITSLHILGGCCGTCRSYLAAKIQSWMDSQEAREAEAEQCPERLH